MKEFLNFIGGLMFFIGGIALKLSIPISIIYFIYMIIKTNLSFFAILLVVLKFFIIWIAVAGIVLFISLSLIDV